MEWAAGGVLGVGGALWGVLKNLLRRRRGGQGADNEQAGEPSFASSMRDQVREAGEEESTSPRAASSVVPPAQPPSPPPGDGQEMKRAVEEAHAVLGGMVKVMSDTKARVAWILEEPQGRSATRIISTMTLVAIGFSGRTTGADPLLTVGMMIVGVVVVWLSPTLRRVWQWLWHGSDRRIGAELTRDLQHAQDSVEQFASVDRLLQQLEEGRDKLASRQPFVTSPGLSIIGWLAGSLGLIGLALIGGWLLGDSTLLSILQRLGIEGGWILEGPARLERLPEHVRWILEGHRDSWIFPWLIFMVGYWIFIRQFFRGLGRLVFRPTTLSQVHGLALRGDALTEALKTVTNQATGKIDLSKTSQHAFYVSFVADELLAALNREPLKSAVSQVGDRARLEAAATSLRQVRNDPSRVGDAIEALDRTIQILRTIDPLERALARQEDAVRQAQELVTNPKVSPEIASRVTELIQQTGANEPLFEILKHWKNEELTAENWRLVRQLLEFATVEEVRRKATHSIRRKLADVTVDRMARIFRSADYATIVSALPSNVREKLGQLPDTKDELLSRLSLVHQLRTAAMVVLSGLPSREQLLLARRLEPLQGSVVDANLNTLLAEAQQEIQQLRSDMRQAQTPAQRPASPGRILIQGRGPSEPAGQLHLPLAVGMLAGLVALGGAWLSGVPVWGASALGVGVMFSTWGLAEHLAAGSRRQMRSRTETYLREGREKLYADDAQRTVVMAGREIPRWSLGLPGAVLGAGLAWMLGSQVGGASPVLMTLITGFWGAAGYVASRWGLLMASFGWRIGARGRESRAEALRRLLVGVEFTLWSTEAETAPRRRAEGQDPRALIPGLQASKAALFNDMITHVLRQIGERYSAYKTPVFFLQVPFLFMVIGPAVFFLLVMPYLNYVFRLDSFFLQPALFDWWIYYFFGVLFLNFAMFAYKDLFLNPLSWWHSIGLRARRNRVYPTSGELATWLTEGLDASDLREAAREALGRIEELLADLRQSRIQPRTFETRLETFPPEVQVPDALQQKISHDPGQHMLRVRGVVSEAEQEWLLRLSSDDAYQRAVGRLFRKSQSISEDRQRQLEDAQSILTVLAANGQLTEKAFLRQLTETAAYALLGPLARHPKNFDRLPSLSVQLPAFREGDVIESLLRRVQSHFYPQEKFQVILITVESDRETLDPMLRAAQQGNEESNIDNIELTGLYATPILPEHPLTKPYGTVTSLSKVEGEYVVIWDAEDDPDPDQALKVVWGYEMMRRASEYAYRRMTDPAYRPWTKRFITGAAVVLSLLPALGLGVFFAGQLGVWGWLVAGIPGISMASMGILNIPLHMLQVGRSFWINRLWRLRLLLGDAQERGLRDHMMRFGLNMDLAAAQRHADDLVQQLRDIATVTGPDGKPQIDPSRLNLDLIYELDMELYNKLYALDAQRLIDDALDFDVLQRSFTHADYIDKNLPITTQGLLNWYNWPETTVTKLFSHDYEAWFKGILLGLSILKTPIPLGGTTNWFRTRALRSIGYHAFHNVAEDNELGARINQRGYRTILLWSNTLEEEATKVLLSYNPDGSRKWAWVGQRSRWEKGADQTLQRHLAQPGFVLGLVKRLGVWGALNFFLTIGGSAWSAKLYLVTGITSLLWGLSHVLTFWFVANIPLIGPLLFHFGTFYYSAIPQALPVIPWLYEFIRPFIPELLQPILPSVFAFGLAYYFLTPGTHSLWSLAAIWRRGPDEQRLVDAAVQDMTEKAEQMDLFGRGEALSVARLSTAHF